MIKARKSRQYKPPLDDDEINELDKLQQERQGPQTLAEYSDEKGLDKEEESALFDTIESDWGYNKRF